MNTTGTTLTTIPTIATKEATSAPAEESTKSTETTATTPEAAPSETKPKEAEPEDDKHLELAKRFESVAKRESRVRRLETDYQQKIASLSEKEKAMEAKIAELEAALEDPVDYYLRTGKKDPVEVAKRFARPMTEEEKRIKALEDKLAKEDEARTKREKEESERANAARKQQSMVAFVRTITPDECPHLTSLYEAHEVPSLVEKLLMRPADPSDPNGPTLLEHFEDTHGRKPTDKEIRECLEYDAEIRATRLMGRTRPRDAATAADKPQSPSDPAPAASDSNSGPSSISNQHAAPSTSAKTRKKTREELRKELAERLTAESERRRA